MTATPRFWVRLTVSAFFVNFPMALGVAAGVLPVLVAAAASAAVGVILLAIWDGARHTSAPDQAAIDFGVRQVGSGAALVQQVQ